MLLITEVAVVMNELKAVSILAVVTCVWLKDFASLDKLILSKMTFVAFEASFFHFRDNI